MIGIDSNMPQRAKIFISQIIAALALLALWPASMTASSSVVRDHAEVTLVCDREAIAPGDTFTIGLCMKLEPEWHLYWTNPGDAGLAPRLNWTLPSGFSAEPLEFPVPKRIPAGPMMSFGYDGEVVFLSQIIAAPDIAAGERAKIRADVDWLVCKVECIPGEAVLGLDLPVKSTAMVNDEWRSRFVEIREKLPTTSKDWDIAVRLLPNELELSATRRSASATAPRALHLFPERKGIIDNAARQDFSATADGFTLRVPKNKMFLDSLTELRGLLVADADWLGAGRKALQFVAPVTMATDSLPVVASVDLPIWQVLLFAFVGGLILNLMPCVLPVLSIKVLGFIEQANQSRNSIAAHNLLFLLGVLVSFWTLAALLMILQAGGEHLGWGFQLQSPTFLVVLSAFMFLIGLNLFGVFEVGTSLTGIGNSRSAGRIGSFITGVTTTIVATPCTAPFMGTALGFALTQPAMISLAVFTALGLGMAAPYIIVTSSPALLKFVPKPGRWMETLKQAMGFLLMATVVWLAWVLGIQAGATAVALLLVALLTCSVAAWILGRWGSLAVEMRPRRIAQFSAALVIIAGLVGVSGNLPSAQAAAVSAGSEAGIQWEPFSPQRVAQLRQEGRPLLIDFTAAWCLSCKVNEQVAFGSGQVQKRIDELDLVALKADWTARDATITRALAEFGRNSVPLYVLYPGNQGAPIVLPELLTPGIVLEALAKIEG